MRFLRVLHQLSFVSLPDLAVKCPECKSSLVIEITETNNNSSKLKVNPTVQKVRSPEHEENVPMVKSHSHSSIGELVVKSGNLNAYFSVIKTRSPLSFNHCLLRMVLGACL